MSFFCIITIWFLNSYLSRYRTRAIISRGLYIYYPIFEDHFFVFKEVFSENSVLMYGLYSRAAYDGARTVFPSRQDRKNPHKSGSSGFVSEKNHFFKKAI